MKKINLILISVACACVMQACSGSLGSQRADSSDVKTDSTTAASSQTDTSASTNKATDTAFANKAAIAGMAEVALGKMAETKGVNKQIKDFGSMMVMDHSKANTELINIAKTKNLTLPAGLDAEHQAKSDSLSKLSGAEFDKAYAQAMIEGHQKVLALMKDESDGGKDAELKAFAAKTAPIVHTHLQKIKDIKAGIK